MAKREIRPIRVDGNVAYIPLNKGYVAVIDAADVPLVDRWSWRALVESNTVYVGRDERRGRGQKRVRIYLHRVLSSPPDGVGVDHVDGDGLNNRRKNLRHATQLENNRNQKRRNDNTSGLKGVSWNKRDKKWRAAISVLGRTKNLGYFDTPEEAHAAYCIAAIDLHGQFARPY